MENKDVKNEEIKEENNNPQKNWKKILIIGLIVFIIIVVGFGIWYFWIRDKENDSKTEKSHYISEKNKENISKTGIYTNIDGLKLEVIDSINNSKKYQLKFNGNIIETEKQDDLVENIFIIGDEHNIFLVDSSKKKIIYYAKSSDEINYSNGYNGNYNNLVVYSTSYEEYCTVDNLMMIYNKETGAFIKFNDIINFFNINNKSVYVVKNNSILEYDLYDGRLINEEKYDYINENIIVDKNNIYYIDNLSHYRNKEIVKKLNEYEDEKTKVIVFEYGDYKYLNYYRKNQEKCMGHSNETIRIYDIEQEDNKYISYYTEFGMCNTKILIDKVNNKIFDFYGNSGVFKKVKDGYYIFELLCAMEGGQSFVYTEDMIMLGKAFNYYESIDKDENVFVHDNNYIYKYDVHGKELFKSKKYDYVNNGILIDGVLYFIAKEKGNLYLFNLVTDEKVQIVENYKSDVNYDYYVSYDNGIINISDGFDELQNFNYNIRKK